MSTIVITGGAGRIGTMLRSRLARPDRRLRLLDIAPVADITPAEEAIVASVTDLAAMTSAFEGAEAVIHLGGIATESSWERIYDVNINGTYVALEAARRAGVSRVVLASSNHAVGFAPLGGDPVPDYMYPRPDTFYGVSKATMEALGSLYSYRHGMDVICLRILSCFERPQDVRMLSTWLSPDDAGRLFDACLTVPSPGFRVAYGVSANTRGGWVSLDEARALGYQPVDDAERYAAEILAKSPEPGPDDPTRRFLGGAYAGPNPPSV